MHLPGPSSGSLPACLHNLLAVHPWKEHPRIPLCTCSSFSGFVPGMVLYLMLFLTSLVGLMRWWTVYVQLAPHVWTVESLRNVGNGKGGRSSVARAPSPIFLSFATRPRCVHQLVTSGLPRPLRARGYGTKCIGVAMVAFASTTGTSYACFVTYAALHSTRACVGHPVLVAPLGCVHARWLTSSTPNTTVHNGSARFTTVYNNDTTQANPYQGDLFTTLHNGSVLLVHPSLGLACRFSLRPLGPSSSCRRASPGLSLHLCRAAAPTAPS